MPDLLSSWPLSRIPVRNGQIILASQGVRIWAAPCLIESFDGRRLYLTCSDAATVENLKHQQRIAFTIPGIGQDYSIQGSGMTQFSRDSSGKVSIIMEPYRVSAGPETYELRSTGWKLTAETKTPRKSSFAFWYQAFRLVTLPLSALPVLIGGSVAFAQGNFNWALFILTMIGAILIHAGANSLADYFDFKNGVDLSTALSSHLGALAREFVAPETILIASFACFLTATFIGMVLVKLVGWMLLLFCLAGLLGASLYTGRPMAYKYRALGELMLGILMGPVIVMGSYYVQTRSWNWDVFLISLALATLVSSASLANNLRDMPDDKAAGIRTLPMLLGVSGTKKLYYALIAVPYLFAIFAILLNHSLWPMAIVFISIPRAVQTIMALYRTTNQIDNIRQEALKRPFPLNSIRLHFQFGLLAAVGILLAGLIRLL